MMKRECCRQTDTKSADLFFHFERVNIAQISKNFDNKFPDVSALGNVAYSLGHSRTVKNALWQHTVTAGLQLFNMS